MTFLKYTLATILGLFLFFVISFFVLIGIGASASQKEEIKIKDVSVLTLNLSSPIKEKEEENPFEDLGIDFPGAQFGMGLKEIKECIRNAAKDERIKAIYLNSGNFGGGFSMAKEVRDELLKFKESGKPIIAYSEFYSEGSYMLSTVADQILLHPMGLVEFDGFNLEMMFLGGTLKKLDIDAQVIKVGDYKSAAESLILEKMSDYNREQLSSLIGDIHNGFLAEVSKSRSIEVTTLQEIMDTYALREAKHVLNAKMVDKLVNEDEAINILKEAIGITKDEKVEMVGYNKYKKVNLDDNSSSNRIAVLIAEGEIRSGESDDDILGSETFAKEMRSIRENDRIKAVVIRVNSPGGSAIASEVMAREIALTREKKPVIASMSDVAASGGYWISMGCDKIVAQPNTITGSIGVIGVVFNFERFMKDKLGITFDKVKTGRYADIVNGTHEISEEERAIVQDQVDKIYEDFTSKAAKFRNMSVDDVKAIAGGRVWTGNQALERKLIDELGGLERAVELAAEQASLKDYKLRYYPEKENFFDQFMKTTDKEELMSYFIGEPDEYAKIAKKIRDIKSLEGIQAILPYGFNASF